MTTAQTVLIDEEFTVMASSSLPLSVIDASPNNIHFINMAQDTDEYAPVSSTSSLKELLPSTRHTLPMNMFQWFHLHLCEGLAAPNSITWNCTKLCSMVTGKVLHNYWRIIPQSLSTRDDVDPSPFRRQAWIRTSAQSTNDVALHLVERYPDLATCHFNYAHYDNDADNSDEPLTPLTVLAKRPWAFPSGSRFNLWQLIIYHC
ncbi:hypothetical protein CK203_110453 [Vitis vinifera]|uniref:Uncharacterized protein n=1 Tax=Vitis vinifera TaxID=29760 RepID=A0A438BN83_VITVI|nr:hypothetical protein CK203_110453 [Vitis vinifera]